MKTLKSEFSKTWSVTKWIVSIYFSNFPIKTSIFVITEIFLTLSNLFNAYVIALATDKAIEVVNKGLSTVSDFAPIILWIIGSYIFFEVIRIINSYVWRLVSYQDSFVLKKMLANRLSELGIQNLENPEVTNKSQRFNEEMGNISAYLEMVVTIFSGFISFVSAGIVLMNTIPFAAFLFSFVMIFQFLVNQKFIRLQWLLHKESTEQRRRNNTSMGLLTEPAPLKELILS